LAHKVVNDNNCNFELRSVYRQYNTRFIERSGRIQGANSEHCVALGRAVWGCRKLWETMCSSTEI